MATTSIDGLVSGMDTTSVINQLMSIERRPVTLMQARQSSFNAVAGAWGDIGAKIAALRTALGGLDSSSDLALFKAASSDASVLTATAGSSATAGSATFRVLGMAAAHQVISRQGLASSAAVVGAGTATVGVGLSAVGVTAVHGVTADLAAGAHTLKVVDDGGVWKVSLDDGAAVDVAADATVTLPLGPPATGTLDVDIDFETLNEGTAKIVVARTSADATAADLASALSVGGHAGAQLVALDPSAATGTKLVLTSPTTGTANALTLDLSAYAALDQGVEDLRAAADARIQLDAGGLVVATRPTNSVTDLLPGITLNLAQADPDRDVTVTVGRDADGIVGKVKALVDALNGVTSTVGRHTAYNATSKTGGALLGESAARNLAATLSSTVGGVLGSGAFTLFSQLGVNSTRSGGYTMDEAKLRSALSSEPQGVTTALTALAAPVAALAQTWDGTSGAAAQAKTGAETEARSIQTRIDAANVRLAIREERLRKQFGSLETLLGTLRNQSSWLASQIAGLPSYQ